MILFIAGHYIAWVREQAGSEVWWKFDDHKVSVVPGGIDDIMKLRGGGDFDIAYLSFYRLRE